MVETSPTTYNWICFVYLADIAFIAPPSCNEGILRWIEFSDLANIPTPETDAHIYRYVLNKKQFMFNVEYDQDLNILEMTEETQNIKLI